MGTPKEGLISVIKVQTVKMISTHISWGPGLGKAHLEKKFDNYLKHKILPKLRMVLYNKVYLFSSMFGQNGEGVDFLME